MDIVLKSGRSLYSPLSLIGVVVITGLIAISAQTPRESPTTPPPIPAASPAATPPTLMRVRVTLRTGEVVDADFVGASDQNLSLRGGFVDREVRWSDVASIDFTSADKSVVPTQLVPPPVVNNTQNNPGVIPPMTESQKAAATAAIRALRGLQSVAFIVTNQEYRVRVADAQIAVDEALRSIPNSPLKDCIKSSMGAYADAQTLWDEAMAELQHNNPKAAIRKDTALRSRLASASSYLESAAGYLLR